MIRCAHPAGRLWRSKTQCVLSNPVEASHPSRSVRYANEKAWTRIQAFSLKYGGEGGVRTLDTLSRIHTFQACSFSHSDTSPYFSVANSSLQRGATIGSEGDPVKHNFCVSLRSLKLCSDCRKLRRTARWRQKKAIKNRGFSVPQTAKKSLDVNPGFLFRIWR